jgi:replication factor A1
MSTGKDAEESTSTVAEKTVSELAPHMSEVNITVKVMSKSDIREVPSRFGESVLKVADALVGDSTGCILMTLWNDEIDKVNENETISIKNGKTSLYRGSMRLKAGKYGTIEPSKTPIAEVNGDNNLSDRQFEEPSAPKFRPLYGGMDHGRRGGRGSRGSRRQLRRKR